MIYNQMIEGNVGLYHKKFDLTFQFTSKFIYAFQAFFVLFEFAIYREVLSPLILVTSIVIILNNICQAYNLCMSQWYILGSVVVI